MIPSAERTLRIGFQENRLLFLFLTGSLDSFWIFFLCSPLISFSSVILFIVVIKLCLYWALTVVCFPLFFFSLSLFFFTFMF